MTAPDDWGTAILVLAGVGFLHLLAWRDGRRRRRRRLQARRVV